MFCSWIFLVSGQSGVTDPARRVDEETDRAEAGIELSKPGASPAGNG